MGDLPVDCSIMFVWFSGGPVDLRDGFTQTADRAQISGLAIANFAGAGIYAGGGDGPVLRGNLIGTDATGMLDRGNILGVGVGPGFPAESSAATCRTIAT